MALATLSFGLLVACATFAEDMVGMSYTVTELEECLSGQDYGISRLCHEMTMLEEVNLNNPDMTMKDFQDINGWKHLGDTICEEWGCDE